MGTRTRKRKDESGKPSYITPEGYRKLQEEAERLWTVDRPAMTKNLAAAAAEGDRSENAEYIYSKKKLGEIDRRIRFLGRRLDVLTVVAEQPKSNGRVCFGCYVTIHSDRGGTRTYRLVGPDETNAQRNWISIESPVAKAVLGKEEGDEVVVRLPAGSSNLEIEKVTFDPPETNGAPRILKRAWQEAVIRGWRWTAGLRQKQMMNRELGMGNKKQKQARDEPGTGNRHP